MLLFKFCFRGIMVACITSTAAAEALHFGFISCGGPLLGYKHYKLSRPYSSMRDFLTDVDQAEVIMSGS